MGLCSFRSLGGSGVWSRPVPASHGTLAISPDRPSTVMSPPPCPPASLLHIRILVVAFKAHPRHSGESPRLKILAAVTSAKSLLPMRSHAHGSGIRAWTSVGAIIPSHPPHPPCSSSLLVQADASVLVPLFLISKGRGWDREGGRRVPGLMTVTPAPSHTGHLLPSST